VFLDMCCLGGKCLLLHLLEAEARTGRFLCVLEQIEFVLLRHLKYFF
jgi:hypothetical protein